MSPGLEVMETRRQDLSKREMGNMKGPQHRGGWWPTHSQELLLRAALLQGRPAIEAWEAWRSCVDLSRLDRGSHRLLPLLYRNLYAQGIDHLLLGTFRGIYRYTWYRNQILLSQMTPVLRSLHEAGIETLLLKGAALVHLFYQDCGLRPMADFDVLVRGNRVADAMDIVTCLGWTPKAWSRERLTTRRLSMQGGLGFKDAGGRELDLHWHVLTECLKADADDDFWDGAAATKIEGIPTQTLNATDQLLHVCVHGAAMNPVPPIRWAADAAVILKHAGATIDWNRLIEQARKRHVVFLVRDALGFLRDVLDAPVPLWAHRSIQALPTSRSERLEYRFKTQPPLLLGRFPLRWFQYSRHTGDVSFLKKLLGFRSFLQDQLGKDGLWQLLRWVMRKGGHRIGEATAHHANRWTTALSRKRAGR